MTEIDPAKPAKASPMANNVVPLPAASEPRPSDKVISFVKRHPVLAVTGALAAGVAASALLPRKSSRKLLGKAMGVAESAGAATLVLGREAGEKAGKAGYRAAHRLERYGLAALATANALGRATAIRAGKLGETAADKATRIGTAASETSHKALTAASGLKKRIGS